MVFFTSSHSRLRKKSQEGRSPLPCLLLAELGMSNRRWVCLSCLSLMLQPGVVVPTAPLLSSVCLVAQQNVEVLAHGAQLLRTSEQGGVVGVGTVE